eukprot:TRINITY_DN2231_c0_g1_i1.p1 TRINITY_DN2231_c0_g1~~TRINITY_DN2231_c0_g1_i1.p1  ORF type:complete len:103 (-),score=4.21 TRINITY_DN2231_c0_g1_i1:259-567(-)
MLIYNKQLGIPFFGATVSLFYVLLSYKETAYCCCLIFSASSFLKAVELSFSPVDSSGTISTTSTINCCRPLSALFLLTDNPPDKVSLLTIIASKLSSTIDGP